MAHEKTRSRVPEDNFLHQEGSLGWKSILPHPNFPSISNFAGKKSSLGTHCEMLLLSFLPGQFTFREKKTGSQSPGMCDPAKNRGQQLLGRKETFLTTTL